MLASFSKNRERIYSFFVYLIVFLSSVFPYGDKDWGWHYKYGEYFFAHGQILRSDIFSWTMSGYQWINHSWLYDPLLYILTNLTGYVGLSLVGAGVNLLTFYFLTANFKLDYWKKAILAVPFILIGEVGIMFGLRSQVISSVFLAFLLYILIRSRTKIKFLLTLPPLFFLWANMHGDFILGLGILGLFLGYYFLIDWYLNKKPNKKNFLIFLAAGMSSFVLTFLNPFGYHVYFEAFRHISNPYLKNVFEWDPIYQSCSYCHVYTFIPYAILIFLISFLYLKKKRWFALPFLTLAIIFAWPTIDTRRLLPIFVIMTLPLLADFIKNINIDLGKYKLLPLISIAIIVISLEFNLYNRFTDYKLYNFTESDFCSAGSDCSVKAINYLISHPPTGRGFTFYDWGGYMIGRSVPTKLFVDGRMHLWKNGAGYTAFGDYIQMYYLQNYKLFNKYDFDWLFIQNNSDIANKISSTRDLGIWKLEFQDGNSSYFVRVRK